MIVFDGSGIGRCLNCVAVRLSTNSYGVESLCMHDEVPQNEIITDNMRNRVNFIAPYSSISSSRTGCTAGRCCRNQFPFYKTQMLFDFDDESDG